MPITKWEKLQIISVGENKIIKTEQNIAFFTYGFFWTEEKENTVLTYVSRSNSVQPFLPPCFVQENILVSKKKVVQLHSVSELWGFFFVFFQKKAHGWFYVMWDAFYLKLFLSVWDLLDNLIWSWALQYKFRYCLCNP